MNVPHDLCIRMFGACLVTAAALGGGCTSSTPDAGDGASTGSETDTGASSDPIASDSGTFGSSRGELEDTSAVDDDDAESTGAPNDGFTPADCRFLISDALVAGVDYECGDVAVPQQRDGAGGSEINVHFVRFFGPVDAPVATIYLDGGPGSSGQVFAGLPAPGIEAFAASGDFVVVAQRGTALADPALMCEGEVSTPQSAETCRDALLADQLDLTRFTTTANADDIEDLRVALGYQQWNLLGISYGTRLAQEVMRRHPSSVRAALLDGVVPPQINWDMRTKISFWGATQALAQACAADATCSDTFGAFDQAVLDMIDTLDATPLLVGPPGQRFAVDGGMATQLVFRMMYETDLYPVLPLIVTSLRDNNLQAIETLLMLFAQNQGGTPQSALAYGMHWSVKCSDLYNPELGPGIDLALMEADVPETLANHAVAEHQDVVDICALWPKPESDPSLAMPVASDIPTLISSGEFDPVTPPAYGATVAETMTNALTVTFANTGHGALPGSVCSRMLVAAFLQDPQGTIDTYDTSCVSEIELDFVTSEEKFFGDTTPTQRQTIAERLRSRL